MFSCIHIGIKSTTFKLSQTQAKQIKTSSNVHGSEKSTNVARQETNKNTTTKRKKIRKIYKNIFYRCFYIEQIIVMSINHNHTHCRNKKQNSSLSQSSHRQQISASGVFATPRVPERVLTRQRSNRKIQPFLLF